MKQFEEFEAKAHFSEILRAVMNGESIVITKQGIDVAMIIPLTQKEKRIDRVKNSIRALKNLRKGITLGEKSSVRKMYEKGRK